MGKDKEKDGISLKGLMGIALVKKEPYFGSHRGMRFRLAKEGEQLQATAYPEPYSWDVTLQEQKESEFFPLSDQGLGQAVEWLNQIYREKYGNQ